MMEVYKPMNKRRSFIRNSMGMGSMKGSGLIDSLGIYNNMAETDSIKRILKLVGMNEEEPAFAPTNVDESISMYERQQRNPLAEPGFPGEKHIYLPTDYGITKANFAGPGTHIEERIARGDKGVDGPNGIDNAARQHDIDYMNARTSKDVRRADNKFIKKVKNSSQDSITKGIVVGAMKAKKIGENIGVFNPNTFTNVNVSGSGMPLERLKSKILKKSKKEKAKAKKIKEKLKAYAIMDKLNLY